MVRKNRNHRAHEYVSSFFFSFSVCAWCHHMAIMVMASVEFIIEELLLEWRWIGIHSLWLCFFSSYSSYLYWYSLTKLIPSLICEIMPHKKIGWLISCYITQSVIKTYNWLMQICYLHNFSLVKKVCDSKTLLLLHREEQVHTVRIVYRYNQFFTALASEKRHKFDATTWMSLWFWQSLSLPWERSLVNFRAFHNNA